MSVLHGEYILEIIMYFLCAFFTIWFAAAVYDKLYGYRVRSDFRRRKLREILLVSSASLIFLIFHVYTTFVYLVGKDIHKLSFVHQTILLFVCEALPSLMFLYVLFNPPQAQKDAGHSYRLSEEQPLLR